MLKKLVSLSLALLTAFSLVACSGGDKKDTSEEKGEITVLDSVAYKSDFTAADDFKIGFICLHDENSTYDKNFIDAANRMKDLLHLSDSQVIFKTNIPEGNECYEEACDLAEKGCKIVFADSFGHESYMINAAKEHPEVQFCHATGNRAHTEGLDNFHDAFADIYEGRYLAGIAAGYKLNEMIADGKITADKAVIGYVGAFTYAEVISGFTSFYLGAKSVCPTVTMKVQFTGSWYDQALEQEAAVALMNKGCVLISQHADSLGAPSACEEAGVPNVSYNGSTISACPDTFIISSAIDWTPYFLFIAECVSNGTAIPADWCGDIAGGSVVLSKLNGDVAAEGTVDAIKAAVTGLNNGTIKVFDTNNFTVEGAKLDSYIADVNYDTDFEKDTEAIVDGVFEESSFRSAPYFDLCIDGIEYLNTKF